jgi:hypothetical protein
MPDALAKEIGQDVYPPFAAFSRAHRKCSRSTKFPRVVILITSMYSGEARQERIPVAPDCFFRRKISPLGCNRISWYIAPDPSIIFLPEVLTRNSIQTIPGTYRRFAR